MDLRLKQTVAVERIELIARLVANQMGHIRARDKEVAIALIDDLSECFRGQGEGDNSAKMRKIMPACSCCMKTHE